MLGLLKYPDNFSKAQGLNQLWYKDTATTVAKADNNGFATRHAYLIQSHTVKGTFSFRILLKHISSFCEDYDKIVYGLKHNLTLVTKTDDDAIFDEALESFKNIIKILYNKRDTSFQQRESKSALKKFAIQYRVEDWIDPDLFLLNSKQPITNLIINTQQTKVKLILSCMMEKVDLKSGEVMPKRQHVILKQSTQKVLTLTNCFLK